MRFLLIPVVLLGLSACATSGRYTLTVAESDNLRDALNSNILSVSDATAVAGTLTDHYLAGADSARNRRQQSNLTVIGLNAYTAAALAFGWHADNALTSSSLANLVSAFAGNNNPGGETPSLTAIGQTRCIVQNLNTARQFEVLVAIETAPQTYPELDRAYRALLTAVQNGYWQVFLNYRRTTTLSAANVTVPPTGGTPESLFAAPAPLPNAVQQALLAGMAAERTAVTACTSGAE